MLAIPGTLPHTRPFLSAIARNVIQTTRVSESSTQTVLAVIEEKSFVKVTLMGVNNVNNFVDCQPESIPVYTMQKQKH